VNHPTPPADEDARIRQARTNWSRHWERVAAGPAPDLFSLKARLKRFLRRGGGVELAWRLVRRETGDPRGQRLLEAGCGTAEHSLRLARAGNRVVLLDVSRAALEFDQRRARDLGLPAAAVQASILHLPFKPGIFDAAFNVGVLDHFGPEMRARALAEMLRVTRESGRVISVNNDTRSGIHPLAMRRAQRAGRWPFGPKDGVASLRDCLPPQLRRDGAVREYSRGFAGQFEYLHYYFAPESRARKVFLTVYYLASCALNALNFIPGQFRVTVIRKRG